MACRALSQEFGSVAGIYGLFDGKYGIFDGVHSSSDEIYGSLDGNQLFWLLTRVRIEGNSAELSEAPPLPSPPAASEPIFCTLHIRSGPCIRHMHAFRVMYTASEHTPSDVWDMRHSYVGHDAFICVT